MQPVRWLGALLCLAWAASASAQGVQALPVGDVLAGPGSVALSADGRVAAHVDPAGSVRLWEAASGQALAGAPDLKRATAVALSRDGRWLAVGQEDGRLQVWSRDDPRQPLRDLRGHSGRVQVLTFAADDRRLASGSDDGTTQVFDTGTGQRLQVLDSLYNGQSVEGVAAPVAVAFAAAGRLLLVQDGRQRQYEGDRITSVWELPQGLEIGLHTATPPSSDDHVRSSGQAVGGGGWLWAYTGAEHLMVQRLDGCTPARALPPKGYADAVAVDPQGRWVAESQGNVLNFVGLAGGTSATVRLPGRALALLPQPEGRALLALLGTWTRDEGAYAAKPGSRTESVLRPARLYRVVVPGPVAAGPALNVAADAATCTATDAQREAQQFGGLDAPPALTVAARLAPTLPPRGGDRPDALAPLERLRFDARGQLLALYTHHGDLRSGVNVWQLASGRSVLARDLARQEEQPVLPWLGMDWLVADADGHLVRATTGQRLLDASDARGVALAADADTGRVYRIAGSAVEQVSAQGQRLPTLRLRGPVRGIAARNGRLLVSYRNGSVELFAGAPLASVLYRPARPANAADGDDTVISALMLSADGRYAHAVGNSSNYETPDEDRAWRLADGQAVGTGTALADLPGRANRVVTLDERAHRVAVWDLDRNTVIARLPRQRSRHADGTPVPLKATLSEDGRRVASASPDGLVRVWDLDARRLLGEARVGAEVQALAFDPAGRQLAVGRAGGAVWVLAVP
ncbi:MAG: hypothetical protein EKK53_22965 [Burkholderiales bacterium]|nr:MAG: hypothetical protein EKK53_22965 [Burkholderiales bacterium]